MDALEQAYGYLKAGYISLAEQVMEAALRERQWARYQNQLQQDVTVSVEKDGVSTIVSSEPLPDLQERLQLTEAKPRPFRRKSQPVRINRARLAQELQRYQTDNQITTQNQLAKSLDLPYSSVLTNLITPPVGVTTTVWGTHLVRHLGPEILATNTVSESKTTRLTA